MQFGACILSIIPVRSNPSEQGEMVTQLLFGELYAVIEKSGDWLKIRIIDDNYEGWIAGKQFFPVGNEEFENLQKKGVQFLKDVVNIVTDDSGKMFPVVMGSSFRNVTNGMFLIGDKKFEISGNLSQINVIANRNTIIENALVYLNSPYLWGGKSPFGIDCSGFTQIVFKISGINLLRDALQQASMGETLNLLDEAQPGDLVFFNNSEGIIVHTGIYLGQNKIIHASGKVRIDAIDHQGIYNKDIGAYTHSLRLIKKIL